jgi:UDP-N-acetyl-D-galactosamine dehydrogenase
MKISIIGLGYVGLPLAIEFGKKFQTVGYDINAHRVNELKQGIDKTEEVEKQDFKDSLHIRYTSDENELENSDFYIITVPTPIDEYKQPDLSPLLSASRLVGRHLSKGSVVIYESTVFPGCTEDICVPILESESGWEFNRDFYCGYSPERINPGDKKHRLTTIKKVTSGSTPEIADKVDQLYREIITAGTHLASSIKVAEAAKVIENAQRDINIAFVNELALIFNRLKIDTLEVLEAASTKWNFLPFKPGIVGGHCIGVDPYYLTHKAEGLGYHPQVILSGRRINDNMGIFIAQRVIKLLSQKNTSINGSRILILGITFKENCPDIRNSRVIDIYRELVSFGAEISVHDPHADKDEVFDEYELRLTEKLDLSDWDAIVLAVSHDEYKSLNWQKASSTVPVIYDVKGLLPKEYVTERL